MACELYTVCKLIRESVCFSQTHWTFLGARHKSRSSSGVFTCQALAPNDLGVVNDGGWAYQGSDSHFSCLPQPRLGFFNQ